MKRSRWLRELRTAFSPAAPRGRRNRRRRLSVHIRRARVEPLEERTLLATLTVNSPLDNVTPGDGLVTLREAIIAANTNTTTDLGHKGSGADTIQFAPAAFATPQTTQLVFGEMLITESLTINGPGRDKLTIDAQQNSRIFNFSAQAGDLTITDLALTRGRVAVSEAATGGAINKLGSGLLKLERVNITASTAHLTGSFNSSLGGAVSVEAGTLTVVSSLLSGNQASGTSARGGAIASRGRIVNIIDSTIEDNQASNFGQGGGVFVEYFSPGNLPAELTLTGSTISGNTAGTGGGGISVRTAVIIGGTISDNESVGGGIYSNGYLTVRNANIQGNRSPQRGGGISALGVSVDSSTISGNIGAPGGGGGIYSRGNIRLTNSTVSGNVSVGNGGGLFAEFNDITIAHSTVTGNEAANGGGVVANQGTIRAFGSIVAGNTAANNPDLRFGNSNFLFDYNLIGNAFGTSLVEAQTPDARGNLIGSSSGSGIIDPKLAPLADNGGPTPTHALLPGSPAIDANRFQPTPAPVRDYQLNGSLVDELGGPPLTSLGGFQQSQRYAFSDNKGLNASMALANPAHYSLELVFNWYALSGNWQKIVDFHNLASNVGLYTANNGLHFVNGPFTPNLFTAQGDVRLVLTRDDTTDVVRAYVDGNEAWSFTDTAGDAIFDGPNQIIRFFQDDNVTGQIETGTGLVDLIRIYDAALTEAQIDALPNPHVLPEFDQRGEPFARVRDGNGDGVPQVDMGAYELQSAANMPPVFTSPDAVNVPENTTAVLTVTATDDLTPTQAITYAIVGGVDQARFSNTTGGELTFKSPPDFEAPADANGDNVYLVIVEATDGSLTSLEAIVVTVTAVNDASPVFTSPSAVDVVEGTTAVTTLAATDADLPPQTVTFAIVGGADELKFTLTAAMLAFTTPPNFAVPGDANGDNVYEVVVRADDGQGRTTLQTILVTVTSPPADYGDAPDATSGTAAGNYQTRAADNGPRHTIVPGLRLGASIDADSGTLQNATANADDVDSALPDDEDGVSNPAADLALTIGARPTVTLRATNTTGTPATLYGWIDYNADGVFDNATERASIAVPAGTNNGIVTLVFPTVPPGFHGTTYARFRLSTDAAAANPTGVAADGEVEDYVATIVMPSGLIAESFKTRIIDKTDLNSPAGSYDAIGRDVENIGDVDGDGVIDLAISGSVRTSGRNPGAVWVAIMNPDGTVRSSQQIRSGVGGLPTLDIESRFGYSVASVGDLDGDGVPDMAVGEPKTSTSSTGKVYILFLNRNGTVKRSTAIGNGIGGGPSLANNDYFGSSLASLGDLDGDGVVDLAVGAMLENTERGAVHILFMKSDGSVKGHQKIASGLGGGPTLAQSDRFGNSLACLGDIDGDGLADIAVGAINDDMTASNAGAVYVLHLDSNGTVKGGTKIASGVAGGPVFVANDLFGASLASLGDVDGDGITDLAVGAPGDDAGLDPTDLYNGNFGAVYMLLLNSDGTVKRHEKIAKDLGGVALPHRGFFGQAMTTLGDLDRDGLTDLAVSGNYTLFSREIIVLFLKPSNTPPLFTSAQVASVPENTTFVMTVTATDADVPPQTVTFSLVGGADQGKFTITAAGALSFLAAPDFDVPGDANGDNVYEVTVQASDGNFGTATQTIQVTVTPVNDNTPVFTSPDAASVPENTTAVLTVTATDADRPPETITYALVGGSDQAKFNMSPNGVLTFKSPPDFEMPGDANGDNLYVLIVQASDGTRSNLQVVLVTVTNVVNEPLLAGDYNVSGTVDAADYVLWRHTLGASVPPFSVADGSGNGVIDQADYAVWRANFGRSLPPASGAFLPPVAPDTLRSRSSSYRPARRPGVPVAQADNSTAEQALAAWLAAKPACMVDRPRGDEFETRPVAAERVSNPSRDPVDALDLAFAAL